MFQHITKRPRPTSFRFHLALAIIIALMAFTLAFTPARGDDPPREPKESHKPDPNAHASDKEFVMDWSTLDQQSHGGRRRDKSSPSGSQQTGQHAVGTPAQALKEFTFSRPAAAHGEYTCGDYVNGNQNCVAARGTCAAAPDYTIIGGEVIARARPDQSASADQVTVESITRNLRTGTDTRNGYSCVTPSTPTPANALSPAGEPVVITVTQRDFAELPVQPLAANAGPEEGWLPVNMVNVLHTNPEAQTLDTELLGVPVQVRAVPIEYHWDLGDGNTITTTKPGEPFPSEQVTATYSHEGWYDITLTTTFAGQFSVDGGEWQDIDGTIEIASDPVEIFSKSLESRLVNSDVPVDEDTDPWIPARSPETEGPRDPEATHREI